eukprot:UN27592
MTSIHHDENEIKIKEVEVSQIPRIQATIMNTPMSSAKTSGETKFSENVEKKSTRKRGGKERDAFAFYERGYKLRQKGQFAKAIEMYRKAIE